MTSDQFPQQSVGIIVRMSTFISEFDGYSCEDSISLLAQSPFSS